MEIKKAYREARWEWEYSIPTAVSKAIIDDSKRRLDTEYLNKAFGYAEMITLGAPSVLATFPWQIYDSIRDVERS